LLNVNQQHGGCRNLCLAFGLIISFNQAVKSCMGIDYKHS